MSRNYSESSGLLASTNYSLYSNYKPNPSQKTASKSKLLVHELFSQIAKHLFVFPSFQPNNQRISSMIKIHGLEDLMERYQKSEGKILGKLELLPQVNEKLQEKNLNLSNLTTMGLKLNEEKYYEAIAEAMESLLTEKLESTHSNKKLFD